MQISLVFPGPNKTKPVDIIGLHLISGDTLELDTNTTGMQKLVDTDYDSS